MRPTETSDLPEPSLPVRVQNALLVVGIRPCGLFFDVVRFASLGHAGNFRDKRGFNFDAKSHDFIPFRIKKCLEIRRAKDSLDIRRLSSTF